MIVFPESGPTPSSYWSASLIEALASESVVTRPSENPERRRKENAPETGPKRSGHSTGEGHPAIGEHLLGQLMLYQLSYARKAASSLALE